MNRVECLRTPSEKARLRERLRSGTEIGGKASNKLDEVLSLAEGVIYYAAPLIVGTARADWDSQHFGFPIGRVVCLVLADVTPDLSPHAVTGAFNEVADAGAFQPWDLVYCRVTSESLHLVHALEAQGFRLMDELVTFHGCTVSSDLTAFRDIQQIGSQDESFLGAVGRIGSDAFRNSRFYADPHLDHARVGEMFAAWSTSVLANGEVFVHFTEGQVDGYVACRRSGTAVRIDLIAVAPWARGRGVGKELVQFVRARYSPQCTELVVGTQLTNTGAIGLYTACGLKVISTELTFHLWNR